MKTWNIKEKNTVRNLVCKKTRSPYKHVLLLPGKSSLDIKALLKNGCIDKNTSILAVERDPEAGQKIHKYLENAVKSKKIKSFDIFPDELHRLPLNGGENIDFMYLDTCGQLNAKVIGWLATVSQLKDVFDPNCKIYLAFSQYYRQGSKLVEDYMQFLTEEKKKVVDLSPEIVGNETENAMDQHLCMGTILTDIFGEVRKSYIYKNEGKHPAMHVFEFRPRKGSFGITSVFKFLYIYTHEFPQAIASGVKAYIKRHSEKWVKKVEGEKPPEERRIGMQEAVGMVWNRYLPEFHERIRVLEVENATLKLQLIAKMSELNETLSSIKVQKEQEELKTLGDLLKETEPSKVLQEVQETPPVLSGVDFPKDNIEIEVRQTSGRTQKRIKEYLEVKGPASIREIMKDVGLNFTQARTAVNRLAVSKIVATQGLGVSKVVTLIQ